MSTNIMSMPRVGQFVGVSADRIITPEGTDNKYRILLYGAYDAFGLIGPEINGIAILDEDNKRVLTDGLGKESSGYFGPSLAQTELFKRVCEMNYAQLKEAVNTSDRVRAEI